MNSDQATPPTPEEVAVCVYLIWEAEGQPERVAEQHRLQAETQLVAAHHHERLLKQMREPRTAEES